MTSSQPITLTFSDPVPTLNLNFPITAGVKLTAPARQPYSVIPKVPGVYIMGFLSNEGDIDSFVPFHVGEAHDKTIADRVWQHMCGYNGHGAPEKIIRRNYLWNAVQNWNSPKAWEHITHLNENEDDLPHRIGKWTYAADYSYLFSVLRTPHPTGVRTTPKRKYRASDRWPRALHSPTTLPQMNRPMPDPTSILNDVQFYLRNMYATWIDISVLFKDSNTLWNRMNVKQATLALEKHVQFTFDDQWLASMVKAASDQSTKLSGIRIQKPSWYKNILAKRPVNEKNMKLWV